MTAMRPPSSFATRTLLLLVVCLGGGTTVHRCLANEHASAWHPRPSRARYIHAKDGDPVRRIGHHNRHARSKGEENHGHVRKKHRDEGSEPEWRVDEPGLGTWETCDTCERCLLDDPPPDSRLSPAPGADGKVHCNKCLGCSVILSRMKEFQPMLGRKVKVFAGASGAAVMKGRTAERGNVFVKMWCGLKGGYKQTHLHHPIPEKCNEENKPPPMCAEKGGIFGWSECNFKFLNALDKLAVDANLTAATPRSWTENIRSFIPMSAGDPASGVKVETRGQFYEVAEGVSIEAFYEGGISKRTMELTRAIHHDDVIRAATFDLLFSESDRHGQNVFVSETGRLTILDNEGAFGPVNSMLIPGGQKFEVYRIGYNAVCCGNLPGPDSVNCPGKIASGSAPEVFVDYRCHAPGRFVGTALPPGVEPFLQRIAGMDEYAIFQHYGMSHRNHATTLKQRATEMLDGGFERALIAAYSRQPPGDGKTYGNNFSYALQPSCCAVEEAHCSVRVLDKERTEFGSTSSEERQVWSGNDPGREARQLWPGMTKAPHLFGEPPTHGKRRKQRRLLHQ